MREHRYHFMRNESTANDYATTADVILEVLESYERIGQKFDQGLLYLSGQRPL